jgi:hypothetical protein
LAPCSAIEKRLASADEYGVDAARALPSRAPASLAPEACSTPAPRAGGSSPRRVLERGAHPIREGEVLLEPLAGVAEEAAWEKAKDQDLERSMETRREAASRIATRGGREGPIWEPLVLVSLPPPLRARTLARGPRVALLHLEPGPDLHLLLGCGKRDSQHSQHFAEGPRRGSRRARGARAAGRGGRRPPGR